MVTIARNSHIREVTALLRSFPVVAVVGARQVGKTTLAAQVATHGRFGHVEHFDLESPADLARLGMPHEHGER